MVHASADMSEPYYSGLFYNRPEEGATRNGSLRDGHVLQECA